MCVCVCEREREREIYKTQNEVEQDQFGGVAPQKINDIPSSPNIHFKILFPNAISLC